MRLDSFRKGEIVPYTPSGFPLYVTRRKPRVVTSDVWSYFKHLASNRKNKKIKIESIHAFIDQAYEFYSAADNPRMSSRPLLYYYSFMNLAKAAILTSGIRLPSKVKHGLHEPKTNIKQRYKFAGKEIRSEGRASNKEQLFPEFVNYLGGYGQAKTYKIISMLEHIPGVHRTFCQVRRKAHSFLPVKKIVLLKQKRRLWVRFVLDKEDVDVIDLVKKVEKRREFKRVFSQVLPPKEIRKIERWYETEDIPAVGRGADTAIVKLAKTVRSVGIRTILTGRGQRLYFSSHDPKKCPPQLASIYAVMFYLGSITRYKPYDFDRIISKKYSWLIGEFLNTQPLQFLYLLASYMGDVDVVHPFAIKK